MVSTKKFGDYLNNSTFIIKLLTTVTPIYAKHMKQALEDEQRLDFDEYGDQKEKHLKRVMSFVGSLQSYFEDLEKVLDYLKVDKSKLPGLYDNTLSAEDYYKYHYDNFAIRIMTSIDLCGKIGIALYKLPISEKFANWHSFSVHKSVRQTEPAKKILAFSDFLDDFRNHRHNKIHQGKSLDNRFDNIVFWENIGQLIGDATINSPILEQYNQKLIIEAVEGIEEIISKTAELAVDFLDSLTAKLNEILSE